MVVFLLNFNNFLDNSVSIFALPGAWHGEGGGAEERENRIPPSALEDTLPGAQLGS